MEITNGMIDVLIIIMKIEIALSLTENARGYCKLEALQPHGSMLQHGSMSMTGAFRSDHATYLISLNVIGTQVPIITSVFSNGLILPYE